jgi:NAD(P)-dependent dehydrogenase (short-subunit alcohol dehydrogenase family)
MTVVEKARVVNPNSAHPKEQSRPVLVTGSSTGIGRTIVEHLSAGGHPVLAGARKESDLQALKRLPNITPVGLDVTRSEDVDRVAARIRDSGHGLYGLVNNAGILGTGPLTETTVDEFHRVLAVNLDGIHRMVCAMFPFLRESKGRIVNISSAGGIGPMPFFGPYSVSKHAIEGYSDILQREVSPFDVRVSIIEPGVFQSNILQNSLVKEDRLRSESKDSIYGDRVLKALHFFTDTSNPEPTPVAEAVAHALFSPEPKLRYLVCDRALADRIINWHLTKLRQLNEQQPHSLPTTDLVARLQKILA